MPDYWIKLYIEIIDDPKMATLPDRLWRRAVELFMLAGKFGKDGHLPETKQLAWILRQSADDLDLDLRQIASTGMLEKTADGWFVVNFAKRQAPVPSKERMAKSRERRQRNQYYNETPSVTNPLRNATQINRLTETDSDSDSEENSDPAFPVAPEIALYHEVTGLYPNFMDEERVKQKIRDLRAKLKYPPVDVVKQIMLEKYSLWKSCTTKDGRPYSPSNPDWLDWCITDYAPKPTVTPPMPKMRKLTDAHGNVIEVPA